MPVTARLSAVDAAFLDIESARTPMHIVAVGHIEPGHGERRLVDARGHVRLAAVRDHVAARLDLLPRLRQVVRDVPWALARPVWVDDGSFDVANHVRVVRLPTRSDERRLAELASESSMTLLDRARPLWELVFVEGLADGSVGLIEKVHHALVDGVAGVNVTAALADTEPDAAPEVIADWSPTRPPNDLRLVADAARDALAEPVELVRRAVGAARHPRQTTRDANDLVDGLRTLTARFAPSTSLNRSVGDRRRLATTTLPLDTVKQIAHAHGTKVNSVVLALVSGGLRALLLARGEPAVDLLALVPRSVRTGGDAIALTNRISAFIAPLPVGEPDPRRRVDLLRDTMLDLREHHESEAVESLVKMSDHLPHVVFADVARLVHQQRFVNVVVTNVPGPSVPLYVLGGRLVDLVPVVPLGGNTTVGVAVLSYVDQVTIAVHADADACPDVDTIVSAIDSDLSALARTDLDPDRRARSRRR